MGGPDTDAADRMEQRLDDQQRKADADVESRRASLARTRLNIVKSAGTQSWRNPDAPDSLQQSDATDLTQQ